MKGTPATNRFLKFTPDELRGALRLCSVATVYREDVDELASECRARIPDKPVKITLSQHFVTSYRYTAAVVYGKVHRISTESAHELIRRQGSKGVPLTLFEGSEVEWLILMPEIAPHLDKPRRIAFDLAVRVETDSQSPLNER